MQEEAFRYKYSALAGPILFWIVWASIALIVGVGFLFSAFQFGEKGPFWVWIAAIVPLAMATCGYTCAFRKATGTVSVVLKNEDLAIEENSTKIRQHIVRRKDVRAISVVRLGVDPTEGPDSFPRYGVVVSLERDFLLIGELPKFDMLTLGKKIAAWAGVESTDLGEKYFRCDEIWGRNKTESSSSSRS